MRWYEDLMAWLAIVVVCMVLSALAYVQGVATVVNSCDTYRAYKVDDERVVYCMVMPITHQRGVGELNYLRPEGKKPTTLKDGNE